MSCLFAVTTDLPDFSALRIHSPAGSRPPMSSTTMCASDERTSLISSVQRIAGESEPTRLRSDLAIEDVSQA